MALTLARKVGQSIRIGTDIVLTVVGFAPDGRVMLGISAPREVPVDRSEVTARKMAAPAAGGAPCRP
jgi:carbon storage regulator